MKKILSTIIFFICIFLLSITVLAQPIILNYDGKDHEYTGDIMNLKINGDVVQSKVTPVVLNDRTLVPARAIFEKLGANVSWIAEQQKVMVSLISSTVELKINDTTAYVNGSPVTLDVPAKLINESTMIPARFVAEQLNMKVDWKQNEKLVTIDTSQLGDITYQPDKNGMVVSIKPDFFQNYKVLNFDPSRIVIDFPNMGAPGTQQRIDVNTWGLKDIRYAKFQDANGYNAARVVLDVDPSCTYKVEKRGNNLLVYVISQNNVPPTPIPTPTTPAVTPPPTTTPPPVPTTNPSKSGYKGITYNKSGDRVFFKLNFGDLAYMPKESQKKYYDFYEEDGKKYTMRYKPELADLGEGVMNINDEYFDSVEFQKSDSQGYSRIIFHCKTKLEFQTFKRYNYDTNEYIDTVIDVLKPVAKTDRLVVIDPGHGGLEWGASSGGLVEKKLNLDIALRVNKLLKEKGVKTYITRGDDSYVDLYERAILANTMNATIFVSIHNNAFNGSAYGTETLYYTTLQSGFTSKTLAQYIQNKLISALGSYDRGIISRPNLVVLNRTEMLASLVEVGFIDNAEERAKLMNEDYKQKAAQAICNGIIESLAKVK